MPDRIIHWVTGGRYDPGVKRVVLASVGLLGIIRGLSYINPPPTPAGLRTLDQLVPLEYWGWAWVAIGVLSIVGAFTSHYRMPFVPFLVITSLWAFSYFAEWCMDYFSRGVDSRDYVSAVSYAVQALLILAVIRLIDLSEVTPRAGDEDVA